MRPPGLELGTRAGCIRACRHVSTTSYSVRAGLPALADRHSRAPRLRPADRRVDHAGGDAEPRPTRARRTDARPTRAGAGRRATSYAAGERATTMRPLVSRSSRCTMPGRAGSPTGAISGKRASKPVDERAAGVAGARDARRARPASRPRRHRRPHSARRPRRLDPPRVARRADIGLAEHLDDAALLQPVTLGDGLPVHCAPRRLRSAAVPRRGASR